MEPGEATSVFPAPPLIDGGSVTIQYNPVVSWFREGHGVDPDIEVKEDPTSLAKGEDTQLEKAIELVLEAIKNNGYKKPDHPAVEER